MFRGALNCLSKFCRVLWWPKSIFKRSFFSGIANNINAVSHLMTKVSDIHKCIRDLATRLNKDGSSYCVSNQSYMGDGKTSYIPIFPTCELIFYHLGHKCVENIHGRGIIKDQDLFQLLRLRCSPPIRSSSFIFFRC